eukprot:TRINITY_DN58051_c0_g1_i1.p1 TRINITY_DN58051_c0_g1~~TRINITY_DN58051_c0_g1_i1.p1  ORF type:complete len:337 (-),score=29.65 TRINITY_DN58051_c0_g1_i1:343-1353(-)
MAIFAFGNPLLDVICDDGESVIEKYGLELNNAIHADARHHGLFEALDVLHDVTYSAGGMVQNTIRVAQWMMQIPGATTFVGCVGDDTNADKMREACSKDGVDTIYAVDTNASTGRCACLMRGSERAMCVQLQAAKNFTKDHAIQSRTLQRLREAAITYTTLNFPSDVVRLIANEVAVHGSHFCMNLTAPTWIKTPSFKSLLSEVLPMVDVLFGNEREAITWADEEGWDTTDISFIALRLSLVPSVKSRKRTVVITQGAEDTIVAVRGQVSYHRVVPLEAERVVCTIGAGDAYAGGFLAALAKGLSLHECCDAGAYAASVVVQHVGCTFSSASLYVW